MTAFWHSAAVVGAFLLLGATATAARAQTTTPPPAVAAQDARQEILQSPRWRQVQRDFDKWLSMQRIYSADEVARIRAEMTGEIARMSPDELEAFLDEMDDRLDILFSREAAEARDWVSQFLATARNAEQQLRDKLPDVLSLTAEEIRIELQRFQGQRSSRQQAQSASERARSQQVQTAQTAQAARNQGQDQMRQSRSRAAESAQNRRAAAPRGRDLPNYSEFTADDRGPVYGISPWGTPIRWNALSANNR